LEALDLRQALPATLVPVAAVELAVQGNIQQQTPLQMNLALLELVCSHLLLVQPFGTLRAVRGQDFTTEALISKTWVEIGQTESLE
jgi:hypothetical protein